MSIPSMLISCFMGLVSCGDMVLSDSEIIVAHRSRSAQGRVHFITTELKEAHISRKGGFAEAPKHPQVRLEQGEQTLRPILVHVPTRVFFLRMIDERVHVALHRPIAARRVGRETAAR